MISLLSGNDVGEYGVDGSDRSQVGASDVPLIVIQGAQT
jgi:hypothetical protein